MIPFGKALCFWLQIYPRVNQLWPPEGDKRITNMDVVFFSDLEDDVFSIDLEDDVFFSDLEDDVFSSDLEDDVFFSDVEDDLEDDFFFSDLEDDLEDDVFFSDLEDERTAALRRKPEETCVQKGHPEVCWPQQWLLEELGNNVRILEIRPWYSRPSTWFGGQSLEVAALRQLDGVAKRR